MSVAPVNRFAGSCNARTRSSLSISASSVFQTRPARAFLELGEQSPLPRPRRGGDALGHQSLEAGDDGRVQPRHRGSAEPVGSGGAGAGHQTVETAWGFDSLVAAANQQRISQPFVRRLEWGDLSGQPLGESLLVGAGRRAETERVADLRPVVLDRAARPHVPAEQGRIDPHLTGDVGDRGRRQLPVAMGETALQLEELQQQDKAQPRRPSLVADQPPVILDQRP